MSRDIRYVKVGKGKYPRIIVDSTVMVARDAARLLAGLEVALAAALVGNLARCLRCGSETDCDQSGPRVDIHCDCGGVLAPVKGRQP